MADAKALARLNVIDKILAKIVYWHQPHVSGHVQKSVASLNRGGTDITVDSQPSMRANRNQTKDCSR